jgi:hypothetical protein
MCSCKKIRCCWSKLQNNYSYAYMRTYKVQEKPPAFQREFLNFFLVCGAFLDPDPQTQLNPDSKILFFWGRARQRFLKRDRVGFYAKKLIRRVEDNVKYVEDLGLKKQIQGKRIMRNIAKKLILGQSRLTTIMKLIK